MNMGSFFVPVVSKVPGWFPFGHVVYKEFFSPNEYGWLGHAERLIHANTRICLCTPSIWFQTWTEIVHPDSSTFVI
jgi:hypothetical protein